MRGNFTIRRGKPGELQALLWIASACADTPRWSESAWREMLAGEGAVTRAVFVAERVGELMGFIVVGCAADVAEIESVAVLAALRRMGVGRALCMEAMRWAQGEGTATIELEVRVSSAGAIGLYRALGFVEQGRRRGYYSDPVDDAVLMAMDLQG